MGKEKKKTHPKRHRFTRRSVGALSRASYSNRDHLDLTCSDRSPPVVRTARPRSVFGSLQSLNDLTQVLICPIGTSSTSRRFATGIGKPRLRLGFPDARASARLAERETDSTSKTGRRRRSIPREASRDQPSVTNR